MRKQTLEKMQQSLDENERAHQRLTKAAPELLEACRAALEYVENSIQEESDLSDAAEVRDQLKDAIRFATGGKK